MPSSSQCVFRVLIIAVLTFLLHGETNNLLAQSSKGTISGQVTDPSGGAVRGANISLEPSAANAVSDAQGNYFINDVSAGTYTLTVSYVGFATLTQTVVVNGGATATVDANMQLQSQNQQVIVTAARATGEVSAINEERTADNVEQVLPEEVIRSLPNANMADALGRMPAVTLERDEGEGKYVRVRGLEARLTNTTIDGVNVPSEEPTVRQIKFDAIPADVVQEVQVSKTLLANMDGDGIGGSVNLVTRTATDRPIFSLSSMGGYTPIENGRGLTEETGTIGRRFGPDKKFGAIIGGSYDWNGRGIDDVEPVPDIATLASGSQVSWKDGMDIREYKYFRSRWGLAGSTDYRVGEASDIYLRGLYSDFHNYGDRWAYTFTDNTPGIHVLNPSNVGNGTAPPTFNAQLRNPDIGVGSLVLGGTHILSTMEYTWEVAASRSHYGNSPYSTAVFSSTLPSSTCEYDPGATTSVYLPQWNSECYTEAYNPSNLVLNNINRDLGTATQTNLQAGGSIGKSYHIGTHSSQFEAGGKFRSAHKLNDGYVLTLTPNGTIPMTTFANQLTNNNYYGGDYKLGYNPTYEEAIAYANSNPAAFTSSSTQGQDGQEYHLIEQVGAGYAMNTIDLSSKLRFIAGVRVERTTENVHNFSIGTLADGTAVLAPNHFTGSYTTVLPSASLKYAVGNDSFLRFVYARGLSRPDPSQLAQALQWTVAANGGNRSSIQFGNPNLKAETGDDFDVLFDHYLSTGGIVSAGYFYKRLENPIVQSQYDLNNYQPAGGPLGNWLASAPVNAGSAWVSGLELNYVQHFTSLPGLLNGLGIWANYEFTGSSISDIPGRSDHPRLVATSPNEFNISPTFDYHRVSINVGMSYNQANIYAYQFTDCTNLPADAAASCSPTAGGVNGPLSDVYFYSHFQIDAQGSVRLSHRLQLVAYGLNLNNAVFGFYQGSPQYMIQREYYRPTISAGIRWSTGQGE